MHPNPSLWSVAIHSPRVVVDFATGAFFENWEKIAVGFSIVLAGSLLTWICVIIAEKLTNTSSSKRKQKSAARGYIESTRHSKNSIIRVVFIIIAITIFTFSFSIAFAAAGVNFFSLAFSLGLVALFTGTAFGSTIKNLGAFFMISLTNKIEEGWGIEVNNVYIGEIKAIHIMWVELEKTSIETNPQSKETEKVVREVYMPTSYFLDGPFNRRLDPKRYKRFLQKKKEKEDVLTYKNPRSPGYSKKRTEKMHSKV